MISPIAKALVERHDAYLTILEQAGLLVQKETLAVEADKAQFTDLVQKLHADVVSPTLLLSQQQGVLEQVYAYAHQQLSRKDEQQSPDLEQRASFALDTEAADNGNKKLPEEWFMCWEKDSSNRVMASAGDLYQAWKQLKRNSQSANGDEVRRTSAIVAGFRDDFDWPGQKNYLVGGTRFEYQPETLDTTITQHYRCKRKDLVKTTRLEVEEYLGVPIAEVASHEKGLRYLQVFFDTEDDAETIMQTLEFISDKPRAKIKIWTPPLRADKYYDTRKKFPNRAAGFNYNYDNFHVGGNNINDAGRSRGVAVE